MRGKFVHVDVFQSGRTMTEDFRFRPRPKTQSCTSNKDEFPLGVWVSKYPVLRETLNNEIYLDKLVGYNEDGVCKTYP